MHLAAKFTAGITGIVANLAVMSAAPASAAEPATRAADPVQINCKYENGITNCSMVVQGGYCGASRAVGVGVTTAKKGGITVTTPLDRTLTWNAGSVRDHRLVVGTTYAAVVTLQGQATSAERPYPTCTA